MTPVVLDKIKVIATELDVEQGTDEWLEARLGRATASQFKDILAKIGKGESAARRNYRAQLVVERMTKRMPERFKSAAMQWGNDTEDLAATMYMLKTGNIAEKCGIFLHNVELIGSSPDRLIGDDGCMEIKCYNTANHIDVLHAGHMPKEHLPQVQGHMWLTGRKWCHFVSFDPDMPEQAQIFIERIDRDDHYIAAMEVEILTFLREVDEEVKYIEAYKPPEFKL